MTCPKLPWMVDFYSTNDGKVPNFQQKAAYAHNYLQYATDLHIDSKAFPKRLTGIICTIGTKTLDLNILERMMDAGMNIARIKSAVFPISVCEEIITNIRIAARRYSKRIGRIYPVAIAMDIKGPQIRTGSLKDVNVDAIELKQGCHVNLTNDNIYEEHVTKDMIYVDYQKLNEVIAPGDHVYLNDGKVTLSALEIVGSVIRCLIEKTGELTNHSTVTLENVPIDLPSISAKDIEDIKFAIKEELDIIFLSSVKDGTMVKDARYILGEEGKSIMLVAKIENTQGFANINGIIKQADGIMISRGKLANELPQEKLFIVQKNITAKCIKAGKPVIISPQVLESMTLNSKPTKAELLDISNAVLETVDCLVLSSERSQGDYVIETINTLNVLCREAEAAVYQNQILQHARELVISPLEPIYALSIAVVEASVKCNAAAIVMTTTTGRAAQVISRFRPRCPILAVTRFGSVARHLQLFRGVDSIHYVGHVKHDWLRDVEKRIQFAITYGKLTGIITAGDCIIAVRSSHPGAAFVNSMQIYYASEYDTYKDVKLK